MPEKARLLFLLALILLSACAPAATDSPAPFVIVTPDPNGMSTLTPFQPNGLTPTPAPPTAQAGSGITPTATGAPSNQLWVNPAVPSELRKIAENQAFTETKNKEEASVIFDISENTELSSEWIYALVGPFPTVKDGFTFDELKQIWQGNAPAEYAGRPLFLTESTLAAMKAILGEPAAGVVRTVPAEGLTDSLWNEKPALGIVPFEDINKKMKVVEIDGQSPLRKEFEAANYPLKVYFGAPGLSLPASNRDPQKLTTVMMTGTTALVRAIANKMELKGIDYPAQEIGDTLRAADILHITNEIAFVSDGCPPPDPWSQRMVFCSDPRYIQLLEDIGTDVVELTGNHVNDWGAGWLGSTVEMYNARGWGHYGGGSNLADALTPYKITHNGNKIAFIGCNMAGPSGSWATEDTPGSAPCIDYDYGWLMDEIAAARAEGYLPIVTLQYSEYYMPGPSETQARDFSLLADAGAAAVSGSQSHFPQSFAFEQDAFMHYGPGNLFFDQMYMGEEGDEGVRRAFIDRYVIYDGKIIGVELLTTMLEDYALRRWMTPEEREAFLEEYFAVSGW